MSAIVVALGAACRDSTSITDPTAATGVNTTPAVEATAVPASGAPSADVFPTASTGTLSPGAGRLYNLRSGPGTNYTVVGTTAGGTPVATVCTATRTSRSGSAVVWHRLNTGQWIAGGFITRGANASVPPACDSPAGPRIAPGLRGHDYPFINHPAEGCVMDPWGLCVRQCTSFVAWRLRTVNGIAHFRNVYGGLHFGDAKHWAATAHTLGYRVDHSPEVGAVAQWTVTQSGHGHVGWVASVSDDGRSVTIEEYNYWSHRGYDKRTLGTASVDNFIHLY